jgi:nucleoside-diphosphate-sugar epimerase
MILVTGITGYSGRYFLQELVNARYEGAIRCIVRKTSDTSLLDNCGLKFEKLEGDLDDQDFMSNAMVGVDTIVHISSIYYSTSVMKAAVKNGVNRAIFVHTTGIYSKYKSASEEYRNIESNIEKIIADADAKIGLIYLRPTMIYGYMNDRNMIVFIKMVDKLKLLPLINNGNNQLQPVNGRDLGKAYFQILSKSNILKGDYVLSGEKPIKMHEMFSLISAYLNKKRIFLNVPLKLGEFLARCLRFCTFGNLDYLERVQRMGEDRNYSHDEASKDFDYRPMPFSEGLRIEIEEYLSYRSKLKGNKAL